MAATGKPTSTGSGELGAHQSFAALLLAWYRAARRDLPWRRTRDPYAIWVSEIMLQQTQVATVLPYYERWMARFPTLPALAAAEEADVLHAWQGLGYYSRARNLLAGARAVTRDHGGRVPDNLDALLALPGVGPYSAGAIASIAFGRRAPIVDGNVTRVLCRVFGLSGDPSRAPLKARLWSLARELIPEGEAGSFNQALMELGATLCTPKQADCARCPVSRICAARREDRVSALPETAPRPQITPVSMAAAVVRAGDAVLVARVPEGASRWAGMWQFPNTELQAGESAESAAARAAAASAGLPATPGRELTRIRHSVTRYRITLAVVECHLGRQAAARKAGTELDWRCPAALDELAMPSAHRRIARWLQSASPAGQARNPR